MKSLTFKFLSVLLFLVFLCSGVYARKHNKTPRIPPRAILIMISTEKNRAAYLEQKGDTQRLEKLRKASHMAAAAMIHDFSDHFNFCPVFYFYDTNLQDVIKRNYSVLMDEHMKPTASNVTFADSDEVKIAYFGYPNGDRRLAPEGAAYFDPNSPESIHYNRVSGSNCCGSVSKVLEAGLVLTSKDFTQSDTDRRFFIGRNRSVDVFRDHRYSYSSSQFSIDYVRSAEELNMHLTHYYAHLSSW